MEHSVHPYQSCFTIRSNIFIADAIGDRVVRFNGDDLVNEAIATGGHIDYPTGITSAPNGKLYIVNFDNGSMLEIDEDGSNVRVVIEGFNSVSGTLYLPVQKQLAVLDRGSGRIYFFDVPDGGFEGRRLSVTDAVDVVNGLPEPMYMALGENPDEVIVTEGFDPFLLMRVYRICIPGTECDRDARGGVLVDGFNSIGGVTAIKSLNRVLIAAPDYENVWSCPLDEMDSTVNDCILFTSQPEGEEWIPNSIFQDEDKKILYISDRDFANVYVFAFDGEYLGRLETNVGDANSAHAITRLDGFPFAPLSTMELPNDAVAGEEIIIPLTIRDDFNRVINPTSTRFLNVTATGAITAGGMTFETTLPGKIELVTSGSDSNNNTMFAKTTINVAGSWSISMTRGSEVFVEKFLESPRSLVVTPASTDPNSCLSMFPQTLTAGEVFQAIVFPNDPFDNPTRFRRDQFIAEFEDEIEGSFSFVRSPSNHTFGHLMTKAAPYRLRVYFLQGSAYRTEIKNSPFNFDVLPAVADAFMSKHNLDEINDIDTSNGATVKLKVSPFDRFGNVPTSTTGFTADVDGDVYPLEHPLYEHELTFEKGTNSDILVLFKLNGIPLGGDPEHLIISLSTQEEFDPVTIALPLASIMLIFCACIMRQRNIARKMKENIQSLKDDAKRKKHSPGELAVMERAMKALSKERAEELKGVLIEPDAVQIDRMIGKGGFGVVYLGVYNGKKVAVKQLLQIDEESVERFRFECFLMKSLRHPHVVVFVGAVWHVEMLACCLEFVENGTLEDWINKTTFGKPTTHEDKPFLLTWRGHLHRWGEECAMGVQYLHQSRYYSEHDDTWRNCIIHRDLKPDNMLLTPDFKLKLTDFGEARAYDENHTMTTVGTPVYVAPEIMRGDRYNHKADVYSYAVVLVAMIRCERDVADFFFEALRKHMKKADRMGIGMVILNTKVNKGWRPRLPHGFRTAYAALARLISDCWDHDPHQRPEFDEIVRRMGEDVKDEVRSREEPAVPLFSEEPDELYEADVDWRGEELTSVRISEARGRDGQAGLDSSDVEGDGQAAEKGRGSSGRTESLRHQKVVYTAEGHEAKVKEAYAHGIRHAAEVLRTQGAQEDAIRRLMEEIEGRREEYE